LTACAGGGGGGGGSDAGAGEGPVPEPTEPVSISFASWIATSDEFQAIVDDFEKEHPNITIELHDVSADQARQKYITQIAGNNTPDTAYVDNGWVTEFASRGGLTNLDNYMERSDLVDPDDYVEPFSEFASYEGSMYAAPLRGESSAIFYRTDMFEAAGITEMPDTWEEFEEVAAKLTIPEKKQYGWVAFAPESAYNFYPWLWQAGGDIGTPDGDILWDSPEAIEAAEYYVGLTKYAPPDYLNANAWDARLGFFNDQIAMYPAGNWFAGVLQEEAPNLDGKWNTFPFPEGPAGCGTTIASDSVVIFEDSDKKDAAWKWVEYLSSPEVMARLTYESDNATSLPARTSLLEGEELLEAKPLLGAFAEAMPCGGTSTVLNPNWNQAQDELILALGAAFYGEMTPEEALKTSAEKAEEILAD
jgi:ABC-type glycerol-3-phosphate transport system substrate-binding protein